MKKLILILISTFPSILIAQHNEGRILFEETAKLELNFKSDDVDMEHIKSMMPTSNSSKKELIFTQKHSIYRAAKNDDSDENASFESESDGITIKFRRSGANNELYANHEEQTTMEKRDFMGRVFLVSGDKDKQKWKIGTESKEIAGYQCQQAILQNDSTEVIAWFTPQIQVSAGPSGYGNLPGMILEMNIDKGKRVIKASEINLGGEASSDIVAPKKGKAVTKEKFQEIVKEKMKEMGELNGGNTVIKVIERQ